MVIDWTISLGNLVQVASILGGGLAVLLTMRGDIKALKKDDQGLNDEIKVIQSEIKKITSILITQASQDQRILHLEEEMRDLRRGRGFIRSPVNPGIDGEYP